MFRGNYPTRTDDKGRLKVPADFKRVADEKYGGSGKFYITSWDGGDAHVYPMDEWEKNEREILAKPFSDPRRKKFLLVTSYYGQEVEMDGQGRLLLPALLREKANLKGDVAVVGMLDHLEIKNMVVLRKQVEENPFTDDDAQGLSELGK
jgi:MraZ protein